MTNKELNKVQNEVKKASEKTLTGAVKVWCQLFKSGKEINDILKENDIKVDKEIVPALVNLAKDKEVVIQLCKEILPSIDGVFCQYIEVERAYNDENESINNKVMPAEKQAEKMLIGTTHKAFGYCSPVKYSEEENKGYFVIYNNDKYKSTRMATKRNAFQFSLIAKCVTYYLTHPKNER